MRAVFFLPQRTDSRHHHVTVAVFMLFTATETAISNIFITLKAAVLQTHETNEAKQKKNAPIFRFEITSYSCDLKCLRSTTIKTRSQKKKKHLCVSSVLHATRLCVHEASRLFAVRSDERAFSFYCSL